METVEVLEAWIAAWNSGDAETLAGLACDDVELALPQGRQRGVAALREFVARQAYGVRLHIGPQRFEVSGEKVIAVGPVELRAVEDGDKMVAREEDAAAGFVLRDGRVARFTPYDDATSARRAEGFDEPTTG